MTKRDDPAAYQAALDLYTGELLPLDRYEDWAAGRRDARRDAAGAAALRLAYGR